MHPLFQKPPYTNGAGLLPGRFRPKASAARFVRARFPGYRRDRKAERGGILYWVGEDENGFADLLTLDTNYPQPIHIDS